MINSVVLVGRLANDPEMRYTPSGMAITKFRLAVTRRRARGGGEGGEERQEETDWLDIVTFGMTAEFAGQYLDKGALVGIEGRVQSSSWETPEGQKRSRVEIVANNVQFMESKAEAERRRARAGERSAERGGGAPPPEGERLEDVPEGEDYFG
jgi:single-strand DNA-binding protein